MAAELAAAEHDPSADLAMRLQLAEINDARHQRQSMAAARDQESNDVHELFPATKCTVRWHSAVDMALSLLLIFPMGWIALCGLASGGSGQVSACSLDWRPACLHSLFALANVALRGYYAPVSTDNFLFACGSVALALVALHRAVFAVRWTQFLYQHGKHLRQSSHLAPRPSPPSQGIELHDSTAMVDVVQGVPVTMSGSPAQPGRGTSMRASHSSPSSTVGEDSEDLSELRF